MSEKTRSLAKQLKHLRIVAEQTQSSLASKADLSARVVSDIERGVIKSPHRATMERLANALDLRGAERDDFLAAPPPRKRPARRATQLPPRALPAPPTPLVNREREVAAVSGLLRRADVRLVTLLGPVGVGKTRLSLAVAAHVQRTFPDGVWFVDLSAVEDPARLPSGIAGMLGIRLPAQQAPLEALAEHLGPRRVLMILDNLEQVAAGPALAALLQMTTRLKILATSRSALHVRIEHEFPVGPLETPNLEDLPPQDQLAQVEAVALFVQRVQADRHDFRLTAANAPAIATICARLDGLPLAIELAASRVKIFTPEELVPRLASRLDLLTNGDLDLPLRQQSLRAAITWSCDLLHPKARVLFRRFAVFVGGATLAAVEAVCADGDGEANDDVSSVCPSVRLSVSDVWTGLQALVDASLLRREEAEDGEVRFTILQTIREHALAELAASDEEQTIRARHAAWAVALAELAEPRLFTADEAVWLRRLRREQDNLNAALDWSTRPEAGDSGLRLAGAMADYWYLRGLIAEGEYRLHRALDATPIRNSARVKAMVGVCTLMIGRGDHAAAIRGGEAALDLANALGDRLGRAKALAMLAGGAQHQRDYARAFALHRQSLEILTEFDDEAWINNALFNLAWTAHGMGEDQTTAAYAERLQQIAATTHDTFFANVTQLILGDLALAAGQRATAAARYQQVLTASRRRGDRWFAADSLVGCAAVLAQAGEPERGARLLGAAEALYRGVGVSFPPRDRPDYPKWLETIKEQLGAGTFAQAWSAGADLTLAEAAEDAMTIASSCAG